MGHGQGAGSPVCAYRLLGISGRHPQTVMEANIVGRRWELALLDTMIDRAVSGRGEWSISLARRGSAKSRVARSRGLGGGAGVEVFWSYCESHTVDVPFHAVAELLRASSGVADTEGDIARRRLRDAVLPTPTRRICCCWRTCSGSLIPAFRAHRSTRRRDVAD